jgi:hypothetical protein
MEIMTDYNICILTLLVNLLVITTFVAYLFTLDYQYEKFANFYNDKKMKELFGTYLYYQLLKIEEETKQIYGTGLVPKITGMLIELNNDELLTLVNDYDAIKAKYYEALNVLAEKDK